MIEKLNLHYSFTNPASIHDEEALTALELAGRQGAKINEVVTDQNNLRTETENHLKNQDDFIDRMNSETMPAKVEGEIDRAIESGEFDRKINAYMGNLENRVDTLLSTIPEGGTTMDAEVIDGRVDINGISFPNIGSALRGQAKQASEHITRLFNRNRLNVDTITDKSYMGCALPTIHNYASGFLTDFIPVFPGEIIYVTVNNTLDADVVRFVSCFNAAKEMIPTDNPGVYENTNRFEQFGDVRYIRLTISNLDPNIVYIGTYQGGYAEPPKIKEQFLPEKPADVYFNKIAHYNRINPDELQIGSYPDFNTGNIRPDNDAFNCSGFIRVHPGEIYNLYKRDMTTTTVRMHAFYDENKVYIAGAEYSVDIVIPENAHYIRFAIHADICNDVMFALKGSSSFLEYGECNIISENKAASQRGGHFVKKTAVNLEASSTLTLNDFPSHIKKNVNACVSFECDSFTGVYFGRGGENAYSGGWIYVDGTKTTIYRHFATTTTGATHYHGLTLSGKILLYLSQNSNGETWLDIVSNGERFTLKIDDFEAALCGSVFFTPDMPCLNVTLSATCPDISAPLWLIGDSYFGASNERVWGQVKNLGFNNYLITGQPGLNSSGAMAEFKKLISMATPKTLVWYLGMNDGATADAFEPVFNELRLICENLGIELIANKIPTVPGISKEAINEVIVNSGVRYIDSYGAVGTNANGEWKAGLLSSDNVHPTEKGAQMLAAQMLTDVPEVMSYGRE